MDRQGRSANSVGGTPFQQPEGPALTGVEGGEEGEVNYYERPQDSAFSSVTSGARYDASAVGSLGVGEREDGRGNAFDGTAASVDSPLRTASNAEGDSVGRGGGSGSGSNSLDRTSADEVSQWSLEKLREVSKASECLPCCYFRCLQLPTLSVVYAAACTR